MTDLEFRDKLTENVFSYGNEYIYVGGNEAFGLYFNKKSPNYPFIMRGGTSNDIELQYNVYHFQLRNRLLSAKKLKEIMNGSKIPIIISLKGREYLIGKGFLSTYSNRNSEKTLLFLACVDGGKTLSSIEQVKFYVCKDVYKDEYKAFHPVIKDLVTNHPGDVVLCGKITDYVGDKFPLPVGGTLTDLNKYKKALVRASVLEAFNLKETPSAVKEQTDTKSSSIEEVIF